MLACSGSPTRLIQVCTPETSLPPEVIVLLATDPWRSGSGGGGLPSEQMLGAWENWPGGIWEPGSTGTGSSQQHHARLSFFFLSQASGVHTDRAKYAGHAEEWCALGLGMGFSYRFAFIALGRLSIWTQGLPHISFKHLIRGRHPPEHNNPIS